MNRVKTILLLLPILLSGCRFNAAYQPAANYYYLNPNKDLSAIGRTALVELANDSAFPQISADVTEALFQALQKKQFFGLTVIRQSDPAWRKLQIDLDSAYTLEQLSAMRKTLNCDAVLIGTVTGFEPFPHLTIGLRLKLIDLADGELLWALEQIWDTTDKTTQDRIEKYYKRHILPGFETLQEKLGTVSSLRLLKFVAYETAETLQPKMEWFQ
ncbi:MAG: hypothetical protein ACYSRR_07080 [Planctomycetota bacterium]|jgi:hypothetical protein